MVKLPGQPTQSSKSGRPVMVLLDALSKRWTLRVIWELTHQGPSTFRELQARNELDTSYVDDVVMGCVTPVGEQGSDVAKMIVQNADWDESVAGVQLDRFCASGLEAVNIAAQKVASGWEDLVVAGGVECMSRVPMRSNGGPMRGDPAFNLKSGFFYKD